MLDDAHLKDVADDQLGFNDYAAALFALINDERTGIPLTLAINAPWGAGKSSLAVMVKRMLKGLPVSLLTRMGLATLIAPRTSDWSKASAALEEYIDEQHEKQAQALSLAELVETAKQDVAA